MAKRSAGILLYRMAPGGPEVLLVHPGGPFWARKDEGAWSIPKGEVEEAEDPRMSALREFEEELGVAVPGDEMIELGSVTQAGGKVVVAWAVEGDLDPAALRSNRFTIEWPPRSGQMREFPEVDRAEWFSVQRAREKINPAQREFIDRLVAKLRLTPTGRVGN
jgi:predicted NUDIX family NTP pyrophosphohydrolase